MPSNVDFSLFGQVFIAGVAIVAPVFGVWRWFEGRLGKKADKEDVDKAIKTATDESGRHRDYIGKLFEKMDEHARRDEQLFREVMMAMSANQSEILKELGRKADR